jgi:hypothetical protein
LDGELSANSLLQNGGGDKNAGAAVCEDFKQITVADFASNNWPEVLGMEKLVERST